MKRTISWIFGRKANQAFFAQYSLSILTVIGLLLFSLPASGQVVQSDTEYAEGRVIIKFADQNAQQNFLRTESRVQISQIRELSRSGSSLMKLDDMTVREAVEYYRNNPNVEYVEPDYKLYAIEPVMSTDVFPSDSLFNDLWGLHNTGQTGGTEDADIDAPEAWDITTGNDTLIIGVIDTGVDYNHEDLTNNIWINSGETPGDSVDNDGNGYIDDVYGYDFHNDDGDPMDDEGHGTHVAGTIAAEGENGTGITGVSWNAKIMALKFLGSDGSGSTSDAIEAIEYATNNGVHLTNNSWGGGGFSQSLKDAISAAGDAGQLFMAAAGNSGIDNDLDPHYPSSFDLNNIISVAATDHNDGLSGFSNYGETSVDLGAPGSSITSSLPNNDYGSFSGTSMATPHVSGVAALILSQFPDLTQQEVKDRILNSVDPLQSLDGFTVTGGRLNANTALENDETPPDAITDLIVNSVSNNSVELNWTATGDDGSTGTATAYDIRYSTSEITETNFDSTTQVPNDLIPDSAGTLETFTISGLDFNTSYFFAVKAIDNWDNQSGVSNSPSATTPPPPVLGFSPESFSDTLHIGNTGSQTLMIENTGTADLEFSFPGLTAAELLNDPSIKKNEQKKVEYRKLAKKEEDDRTGSPVILGAGGPDEFGYKWIDSDETGGPTFQWEDISTSGILSTIDSDDEAQFVDLGFTFDFYGEPYTQAMIGENGMLTFTDYNYSEYSNQSIPDGIDPDNMIAPYWDDHYIPNGGSIYYETKGTSPNRRFIVQWQSVPHISDISSVFTYQLILFEQTNTIKFQYLEMTGDLGDGSSTTVGIENLDGSDGLQTSFNTSYVHDSLAVSISTSPPWLSVSSTSGTVASGSSQNIDVIFDATDMAAGDYSHGMLLNSNDPNNLESDIPVDLHVDGTPDIALENDTLDLGVGYLGYSTTDSMTISNTGTDSLVISDINIVDGIFSVDDTSFAIPVSGEHTIGVTYTPDEVGTDSDTLSIHSNDPDESLVEVILLGESLEPPVIDVSPTSLSSELEKGDQETQTLTISNTGSDSLVISAINVEDDTVAQTIRKRHNQNLLPEAQPIYPSEETSGASNGVQNGTKESGSGDISTNTSDEWMQLASLPSPKAQYGMEAHPNGNIYVFGGFSDASLAIYDPSTDTWSSGSSMSSSERGMATAIDNDGFIYSFTATNSSSYKYDPSSDTWSTITAPPFTGVWEAAATRGPDGRIYLIGGEGSGASDPLNLVQIYDPATDSWSSGSPMPTSRYGHGAVLGPGDFIYVIGGRTPNGPVGTVEIYDPITDTWSSGTSMPTPRNQFAIEIDAQGKIFTIGGKTDYFNHSGPFFDIVEIYDPLTDSWESGIPYPYSVGSINATFTNENKFFLTGGTVGSATDTTYAKDSQFWLAISPSSGVVSPGNSISLDAVFDATGLSGGEYFANVEVNSNDPENSTVSIPASLVVSDSAVVTIGLREGWNLKSFNVQPEQDSTHKVLDAVMDNLNVALGFKEGAGKTFDPSLSDPDLNSLKTMDSHHGYWLKMNSSEILNVDGSVTDPQTALQLQQGYNLVSYLPENPDSLTHALSSVMDKVEVVLGFNGTGQTFDPSIPVEFNSLQKLKPQNGYWIKLSESAELIYPIHQIAETEEEQQQLVKSKEEEVSSPVKPTREWITVWGKELRMDGELVPEGTVVQAIDSDGVVCGQTVIEEAGKLKMMSIYRDDPETEVDEGAQSNEQITLSLGNHTIENAVVWSNQGNVKNISGQNAQPSSSAIPDEYALKQNYPNPFNPTTTIRYALPEQTEVSIRVYNILGRLVTTLVQDQEMEPGNYQVTFDGSRLASGMYFYRIKAGDFVETKKLLLIK